jgi:hypothetical protein
MVKVVYFPVYFKFRRSGDLRARILATIAVFVMTWALHSYQWFWLRGEWLLSWTDTLFWGILGALVVVNLLLEQRRQGQRAPRTHRSSLVRHCLQIAATFVFITALWSFWQTPTIEEWTTTVLAATGR